MRGARAVMACARGMREHAHPSPIATCAQVFRQANISFAKSAAQASQCPEDGRPEIVFSGRSNVGKSSLLNAICRRHGLARTSKTPGRTQTLNFFNVGDNFRLVDLPGYGYAKAPKAVVQQWSEMVEDYVTRRSPEVLRMVYVLMDSRRGIMELDLEWIGLLYTARVPFKMVFTKGDKVHHAGTRRRASAQASTAAHVHARTHAGIGWRARAAAPCGRRAV